jgi:hypothetical protein
MEMKQTNATINRERVFELVRSPLLSVFIWTGANVGTDVMSASGTTDGDAVGVVVVVVVVVVGMVVCVG